MKKEKKQVKEQVLSLALEGYTSKEISDIVKVYSEFQISDRLQRIKKQNPEVHDQIVFQRELRKNKIIDKDLLDELVSLALQGYLFIEIAFIKGMNEKQVKDQLKILNLPNSPFQDQELYAQIEQIQNRIIKTTPELQLFYRLERLEKAFGGGVDLRTVSKEAYLNRFYKWKLLQAYLQSDCTLTDERLATEFGFAPCVVKRFLNASDKDKLLLEFADPGTCKKIAQRRMERNLEIREKNRLQFEPKSSKVFETPIEEKRFKAFERQPLFWIKVILSFRLSLEELAVLLGVTDLVYLNDLLYQYATSYGQLYVKAVMYLFDSVPSHSGNLLTAQIYIRDLIAAKQKDEKRYRELLKQINDIEYDRIIRSGRSMGELSEEEKQVVAKYCCKYALSSRATPFDQRSIVKVCSIYNQEENARVRQFNCDVNRKNIRRCLSNK